MANHRHPEMEERLRQIVDPDAYGSDSAYHMMVTMFRQWLTQVEWACRDEGVHDVTIGAILNRLTYGHPYGADALLRIEMHEVMLEERRNHPFVQHLRGDHDTGSGNRTS